MILALSHFTLAGDMIDEVRAAFLQRPHHVDQAPGFVRMEAVSPLDQPREFWLLSWWHRTRWSSEMLVLADAICCRS